MELIGDKSDVSNVRAPNLSVVIRICEKSAMECLNCPHNRHPQYNVKLTSLFND